MRVADDVASVYVVGYVCNVSSRVVAQLYEVLFDPVDKIST